MTINEKNKIFDDFFALNNGKYLTVLNPGKQCFDLAVGFTDKLGVPHAPGNPSPFPYPNAYQIYTDFGAFQAQYFDRIPNTPDFIPQKSDILVWDKGINGGIGHVAVSTGEGSTSSFKSFDQNFPTGSVCHVVTHSYNYFLGVLRLKVTNSTPLPPMDQNAHKAAIAERIVKAREGANYDVNKMTEQQSLDFASRMIREKDRAVKWDQLCNLAFQGGVDSNKVTPDQVKDKLSGGYTSDDLVKAEEKGRLKGLNQVVEAIQKLDK